MVKGKASSLGLVTPSFVSALFCAMLCTLALSFLVSAGCAVTILDESNLQGTTGSKYWQITAPGEYVTSLPGQQLSTNNNYAIWILASDVILDGNGLTITGSGIPENPGSNSGYGIRVVNGHNITIKNFIVMKKYYGLIFDGCTNARAENMDMNNNKFGIYTCNTGDIQVLNSEFSQNSAGVNLITPQNCLIQTCNFMANSNGIYTTGASNLKVTQCNLADNQNDGIWLEGSTSSEISYNYITNSGYLGIYLASSSNNNIIYNNYFKNTDNEGFDSASLLNQWNVPPTSGENIIGGNKICGNYWNNPENTGPSEMILDSDGDGICDQPYQIDPNDVDLYPLHVTNSVKVLDESNVKGSSGYQYWDITSPGMYILGFSGDSFYTNNNYAIRIFCCDVFLDGKGKTITGPAPANLNGPGDTRSQTANSVYGIRVNCGFPDDYGTNITIHNINIKKKYFGVIFEQVDTGGLTGSQFSDNIEGVYGWNCKKIQISDNIITSCRNGIVFDSDCNYNTVDNNQISSNSEFGILLWLACSHNIITNNVITNNDNNGISCSDGGTYNTISSNTIEGNPNGIYLYNYSKNKIINNDLTGNTNDGIWIDKSNNNQCSGNTVKNSGYVGIYIGQSSSGNSIYNNYLKNIDNEESDGTTPNNQWSITPVSAKNIIGGPKIGGNFYTNPSGTGFSDTHPDSDNNGFCDSSYIHPRDIIDYYPLHEVILCGDGERIGLFRPSTQMWYMDYDNDGVTDNSVKYGRSTDIPVAGDWDGDGRDEIGLFRPSTQMWYLDYNNDRVTDYSVKWGESTDIPVAGDWDGDGKDEIGLFRPSTRYWYLDYDNDGVNDYMVKWGVSTDMPVAGDWDDDGKDEIGLFRPSTQMWYMDYDIDGVKDYMVKWGASTDIPVAGAWI
jgi:parallel beta-helix repeat protein